MQPAILDATHKPKLSPRNAVVAAALERFDGQKSIAEIVDEVLAIPDCQMGRPQVLRLVSSLAGQ